MAATEGLSALAAEILTQARQQSEELTAAAEERARVALQQARSVALARRDRLVAQAKREAERYRVRTLSAARLEASQRLLNRREELISRALQLARSRLGESLSVEERRAALFRLLLQAGRALGGGRLTVQVCPRDAPLLTPDFWREAGLRLAAAGAPSDLVAGPPVSISGGVIVSKDDGRVVFDNSFEARLAWQAWALRNEVWQVLSAQRVPERMALTS